jgi:O-antigen/teichoic acid export membrane protein
MDTLPDPVKTGRNSLSANFMWNLLRLALNLILPFVILPYVSRVLGPAGFGKSEYALSIVTFFVLFTALGIPVYGLRETARTGNDIVLRSKMIRELTLLLVVSVCAGYVIYFLLVLFSPFFRTDRAVFYAVAPAIFLTNLNYEWFYIGIEQQRQIAIRTLVSKIAQVCLIFLLVKTPSDFIIYSCIMACLPVIVLVWNVAQLKKYVCAVPFAELDINRHTKPLAAIFLAGLAINVYTNIDTTMVGAIAGDSAAGFYAASNKTVRIVIIFIASLAGVFIPRIENALHSGNGAEYKKQLSGSVRLMFLLGVPCCFGMFILAPEIIHIIAGSAYKESILGIRLLCPIIIIVGCANFTSLYVLYPNHKEKYYTISVASGATSNIVCNAILVPLYRQNGAIIGTLAAESIGLSMQLFYARKLLKDTELFSINTAKFFIAACVMAAAVWVLHGIINQTAFAFIACALTGAAVYALVLTLLHEKTVFGLVNRFKKGALR